MFSLIVAIGKNNLIGNGNDLPWYYPEDLKYFKKITSHKNVFMGYNTYLSIYNRLGKALPNRVNYVLTYNDELPGEGVPIKSLEELPDEEIFVIGGKMIYESFHGDDECECCDSKLDMKELIALAIATSIDALAVGVAFALTYEQKEVFIAVALIGVITAVLSAIGVFIGHKFGAKYKNKAELAGGIILVLIGLKILVEHLIA